MSVGTLTYTVRVFVIGLLSGLLLVTTSVAKDKDKKNDQKLNNLIEEIIDQKLTQALDLVDATEAGTSYRVWTIVIKIPSSADPTHCSANIPWQHVYAAAGNDTSQNDRISFKGLAKNRDYRISFPSASSSPFAKATIDVPRGMASDPEIITVDPSDKCGALTNNVCAFPYTITDITDVAHPVVCNDPANDPPFKSDGLVVHGGH